MFNALLTKAKITAVINELGTTVAISHASFNQDTESDTVTVVYKGRAVFSSKRTSPDSTDTTSYTSKINVADGIAYICATGKKPVPGDTLTGKGRTFLVKAVTDYQPADVVIAYKLELE